MSDLNQQIDLDGLVSKLPETYQPIYGHTEFSTDVSRDCNDRLKHLTAVHEQLQTKLGRSVRVLDLGCAQGFFSLSLAKLGAVVTGIDFCSENVAVCQALAAENSGLKVSFQHARIEIILNQVEHGEYDLVLGLSIFHHLVHEHGIDWVQLLISDLAQKVKVGIFEFALKSEPLYWGNAQPEEPRQLLGGFAFVHEMARHGTHLSAIFRPMFVSSNHYWYLNGECGHFDRWQSKSHILAGGANQGTRRYFFGNGLIVKVYSFSCEQTRELNLLEHKNEIEYLQRPTPEWENPRLVLHGVSEHEAWLVRESLPGDLLIDLMRTNKPYDTDSIILDILEQLAALEEMGKFHNDVRLWNVLINDAGKAQLIDFGAISDIPVDCVWPENLFLSFMIFMRELFDKNMEKPFPIRSPLFSPDNFPEPYKSLLLEFLHLPAKEWSYSSFYNLFSSRGSAHNIAEPEGFLLLLKTMEEATGIYKEALEKTTKRTQQAEVQALQANDRYKQASNELQMIYNSYSWRLTRPLRWFFLQLRLLKQYGVTTRAKLLAKKISRPTIQYAVAFIIDRPFLRQQCVSLVRRLGLYGYLRRISGSLTQYQEVKTRPVSAEQLSLPAHKIYEELKAAAINKGQKEGV